MGNFIDLSGKTFGQWLVIERVKTIKQVNPKWLCQCQCGTRKEVFGSHLRNGRSSSCGCYDLDQKTLVKPGYKKGELTVLAIVERVAGGEGVCHTVSCQCSCGKVSNFKASQIRAAKHPHCGSLVHANMPQFIYRKYPKFFDKALDSHASQLFKKYMPIIQADKLTAKGWTEDIAVSKLTRAVYCIAWRAAQGFPVKNEALYIRRLIRSSFAIFWREQKDGLFLINSATLKGSNVISRETMLEVSETPTAKAQTQGELFMSSHKKRKFKRC
jgi:hypothetical protein